MSLPKRCGEVAVLLCLVFALGGCGDVPGPGKEETPMATAASSVPMEQAIEQALALQRAIEERLADELGPRPWEVPEGHDEISRAACNDGVSEVVHLPPRVFQGTYDKADWDRATAIMEQLSREHGYRHLDVVVDRPDERVIVASDDLGGNVNFSWVEATVLQIKVGCHPWAGQPYPGGQPLPR